MAVREMFNNKYRMKIYSNIKTNIKHQINIDASMVIKKELVKEKKKRDGTLEPVYELKLNMDYWKRIKEPISVYLDEAHAIINARRAMSKANIIITDWLALIRRVIGQATSGYGELVFITQLPNKIDIIARDMAHQVRHHVCHYVKYCLKCKNGIWENSDLPEESYHCLKCGSWKIKKTRHIIEVRHFNGMEAFNIWKETKRKDAYYKHYFVHDIENYFPMYDTLQWENLFSEFY